MDDEQKARENCWIVIAAYNEEKKISQVIEGIKAEHYNNIVVVDDGSKDNTKTAAQKAGAIVLHHIINLGQGAALKTGIDFVLQNNADIIVTFDADGQHQPEEIKNMIDPIKKGECEAVLGSRFLEKKSNVSWHRELLLKAGATMMTQLYGITLTDSHNGFRAFTAGAAHTLDLQADRMTHASEILEQIAKKKIIYKEVSVTITYTDYSLEKGQSSTAAFTILWSMIKSKLLR